MKKIYLIQVLLIFTAAIVIGMFSQSSRELFRIGCSPQMGVYYTTGLAIAKIVNNVAQSKKIHLSVEPTKGSVHNIISLQKKDVSFAIVQGDQAYQAYYGENQWETRPQKNLRFIMNLYPEMINFMTTTDSNIFELDHIKGKRLNIDTPMAGTQSSAIIVLELTDYFEGVDYHLEEYPLLQAAALLEDKKINGLFYVTGHPSPFILDTSKKIDRIRFIPLHLKKEILQRFPYYFETEIPIKFYPNVSNRRNVLTLGVMANLVTTADISEEAVYELTKLICKNLNILKTTDPLLHKLTLQNLPINALIPIHPGALRFYQEANISPY